jgi:hypothetical protein
LFGITVAPLAIGEGPASMPIQSQASFTRASDTEWNLDWQGVAGRTYFIQTSVDLVHWEYEPVMAFGTGLWHSLLGSLTPKYFVRLHYIDDPSVTTLQEAKDADFDGDGISNIDEITTMLTNPFRFATNGGTIGDGAQDWDSDGISNADELALGLDPGINNTTPAAGASTVDYAYDDVQRLTGMTSPVFSESYSPDAEGNLQ